MSLADIKKNEEFVRQLEIQGISQNDLSGEPRKGSSKNMTSEEKTFLLSEGRDIPITQLIKVMEDKINTVYTYHDLYYWFTRMGIKPTTMTTSLDDIQEDEVNSEDTRTRVQYTRVQYTRALTKDIIKMWKQGCCSNVISEEIYKKYGERLTPNAINHKVSRLRKTAGNNIPYRKHRTSKFSTAKTAPREIKKSQVVTPLVEAPKAEVTVSFPVKEKKKNVFVRIFEAIFNS